LAADEDNLSSCERSPTADDSGTYEDELGKESEAGDFRLSRRRSTESIGDAAEEVEAGDFRCPSVGRRRSTCSIGGEAEEAEARGHRCQSIGRRRSMSTIEDVLEESGYHYRRVTLSEDDDFDFEAEWAGVDADAGAAREEVERTGSELSIPEEFSSGASQPSAQWRSSSKTVFPSQMSSQMERVDDYDPRKPESIQPASVQEAAAQEHALLLRQILRLEGVVSSREAQEPDSEALEGYRLAMRQMRRRLWRLEVDPHATLLEQGGLFEDPAAADGSQLPQGQEDLAVSGQSGRRSASAQPTKETPACSPASPSQIPQAHKAAALHGPSAVTLSVSCEADSTEPSSTAATQNAKGLSLGWLLQHALSV